MISRSSSALPPSSHQATLISLAHFSTEISFLLPVAHVMRRGASVHRSNDSGLSRTQLQGRPYFCLKAFFQAVVRSGWWASQALIVSTSRITRPPWAAMFLSGSLWCARFGRPAHSSRAADLISRMSSTMLVSSSVIFVSLSSFPFIVSTARSPGSRGM